jgi:hypothetical protein
MKVVGGHILTWKYEAFVKEPAVHYVRQGHKWQRFHATDLDGVKWWWFVEDNKDGDVLYYACEPRTELTRPRAEGLASMARNYVACGGHMELFPKC